MSLIGRSHRRGLALLVSVFVLTFVTPALAAEADVKRSYRPRFVTQTDTSIWDDCTWAAGAMLVDHLTRGAERPRWEPLRRASGDLEGGSTLHDLARGVRRYLGIRLRYSPAGGDPMTWNELLERLRYGGGAVLQGGYSALPRHYTRWSPNLRGVSKDASGHAVFVRRYDRDRDRVWLMDPLGRGDYRGEWIDVRALKRYAYFKGPYVYAAATPPAPSVYHLTEPGLSGAPVANGRLKIEVGLEDALGRELPNDIRLRIDWDPIRLDKVPVQVKVKVKPRTAKPEQPVGGAGREAGSRMPAPPADRAHNAGSKAAAAPAPGRAAIDGESSARPAAGTISGSTRPGRKAPGATSPGATSPGGTSPGGTSPGANTAGATTKVRPASVPGASRPPAAPATHYRTVWRRSRASFPPTSQRVDPDDGVLRVTTRYPAHAGAYRLVLTVTDARRRALRGEDGSESIELDVHVHGDFAARLDVASKATASAGGRLGLPVVIRNEGGATWAPPVPAGTAAASREADGRTRVRMVTEWFALDRKGALVSRTSQPLVIGAGARRSIPVATGVPVQPGRYALVVRLQVTGPGAPEPDRVPTSLVTVRVTAPEPAVTPPARPAPPGTTPPGTERGAGRGGARVRPAPPATQPAQPGPPAS